jgi:hypothetical protein
LFYAGFASVTEVSGLVICVSAALVLIFDGRNILERIDSALFSEGDLSRF